MNTRAAARVTGTTVPCSVVAMQTAFALTTTAPSAAAETEIPVVPPAAMPYAKNNRPFVDVDGNPPGGKVRPLASGSKTF